MATRRQASKKWLYEIWRGTRVGCISWLKESGCAGIEAAEFAVSVAYIVSGPIVTTNDNSDNVVEGNLNTCALTIGMIYIVLGVKMS